MDTNHIAQVLQDKKLQKHLNTKINRQFKTCRYIGDIVISEDEYIILKAYLRSICRKYLNTSERYITSPIFAVALVQIGIHKYDGRFWPHVEREIGTQERGTLIRINEEKYRFDIARAIKCNMQDKTDEYGYILRLSDYIKTDGIFRVNIDIPNSRKANDYSFAVINQFDYKYEDAPFIYKKEGKITFSSTGMILGDEHSEHIANNSFVFRIDPDIDYLPFTYQTANENLALRVYLPAFKWKFDDGAWHTERPEEIWHAEFPKMIYLKFPDDTVCLDMPPLMTDDNEDAEYSIKVEKNKEKHLFVCDTRKMLSWFGFEDIIRPLSLHFESISFVFLRVITHCFLANSECQIVEDRPNRKLWFRSSIIGFSDCVADVYLDGILIAEKVEVKSNGFKLSIPFTSGKYRIEYFEADEEDDFGATDYRLFDTKECNYKNTKDLSDKTIQIVSVTERRQEGSIFSSPEYVLRGNVTVSSIQAIPNEIDSFTGVLSCYTLTPLRVKVTFENPNNMKVGALYFWSDEEDGYIEFMYDKIEGILVLSEDESTSSSVRFNRARPKLLENTLVAFLSGNSKTGSGQHELDTETIVGLCFRGIIG